MPVFAKSNGCPSLALLSSSKHGNSGAGMITINPVPFLKVEEFIKIYAYL